MNVILFGATGMVGQGVLRESLLDPTVQRVLVVGRTQIGQQHPKLQELIVPDLMNLSAIEPQLTGYDACFFCTGVSSAGMSEEQYTRLTYDLTLNVAETLARLTPRMTFIYVSGQGTDSSEKGKVMWARVKGRTENALLRLPLKAYIFRPGFIQPLHGIRSKTRLYQLLYDVLAPFQPLFKGRLPKYITTTERIGYAMLAVADGGYPTRILESEDINRIER
jgi:uncharacterized protein YbjT (DUF2867 family)